MNLVDSNLEEDKKIVDNDSTTLSQRLALLFDIEKKNHGLPNAKQIKKLEAGW